jgi:hypothetical protein
VKIDLALNEYCRFPVGLFLARVNRPEYGEEREVMFLRPGELIDAECPLGAGMVPEYERDAVRFRNGAEGVGRIIVLFVCIPGGNPNGALGEHASQGFLETAVAGVGRLGQITHEPVGRVDGQLVGE